MAKVRKIRRAFVEYQPNLRKPVTPVRLGILAEEITGAEHVFVIVGREPKGDLPELQELWGPFRTVVTEWAGVMNRSLREHVTNISSDTFALDALSERWHSNVYIVTPETKEVGSSNSLMAYATRWWQHSLGEPAVRRSRGTRARPAKKSRDRQNLWISIASSVAEARV